MLAAHRAEVFSADPLDEHVPLASSGLLASIALGMLMTIRQMVLRHVQLLPQVLVKGHSQDYVLTI